MVTKKQIAALKYMIFNSKNGTPLTKQILALLIDRSEKLTKDVCLSLVEDPQGYTAEKIEEAAHGLDAMISGNCITHLDALCYLMGSKLGFSVHYGDFDPTRDGDPFDVSGMFPGFPNNKVSDPKLTLEGLPMRYTFWLARKYYSRNAELLQITKDELEQIDLKKPGLWPNLEKDR